MGREAAACFKTLGSSFGLVYLQRDAEPEVLTRTAWLKRPRGIRYEAPLKEIADKVTGPVSVWRKQMVLGPGYEFALLSDSSLTLDLPDGWEARCRSDIAAFWNG